VTAGAVPATADRRVARARTAALRDFVARRAFTPSAPRPTQRLGAEIEFVALRESTGLVAPLESLDGLSMLDAVRSGGRRHGWMEGRSTKDAPWFRLPSGGRVTFEPGGQVEYASPPCTSGTHLLDDLSATASILREGCAAHDVRLLACGLDPINGPAQAPLQVRGYRYRRMDAYFARIGPAGARMMRQTASLQVAVDIGADALGRWRLLNALAPVLTAVFANSRRYAGDDTGFASYRAETWRRADPLRTGVLGDGDPVGAYVDFALRAPAILLGGDEAPARPFEAWIGAIDETASWEKHLGTLFPEVRPRGYFEVRSIDAVPEADWPAVVALLAGLTYDPEAALAAAEIVGEPDADLLQRAGRVALGDPTLARMSRDLVTVALSGCRRLGPAFLSERYQGEAADFLRRVTS
jgi:glutamate--cysteine ligase